MISFEMHWLSWQPKYAAIHSHVKRIILAWKQIGHNRTRSRRHGDDKVERALATFALQSAWPILFRSVSLWPQRSSHQLSNETCHCKWMQMDWHNIAQHGTTIESSCKRAKRLVVVTHLHIACAKHTGTCHIISTQ